MYAVHVAALLITGGVPLAQRVGSLNGPDVTDITALMQAVASLHGVYVSLIMSPGGEPPDWRMQIVALAEGSQGQSGERRLLVSRKTTYPNVGSKTLEGCLFKLLHELDGELSGFWQQRKLF